MIALRRFLLIGLLWLGGVGQIFAQSNSCKWMPYDIFKNDFLLDSLSVIEESIKISDSQGNRFFFDYNLNSGTIKVNLDNANKIDSLQFCYQTFPYSFHQVIAKRTLQQDYDSMAMFRNNRVGALPTFDFREELFPTTNLSKSGNLTRGVSFGNTQNVFVNSSLNLQMSGELAENLNIRASITDQNVPFQPEGNTQQLQDFDNVLVEIYNDKFNLAAGDVVLQQRRSEFLRYYKNVQGTQFTTNYLLGNKWKASTQAAASVAKGKFASIQLEVFEGTLGPYRIPGPDNERFVIIMANSERVFLDGKQLQRGFNYDYVIDYNQGEITFTPKILITQYSRVRIDFEYAERNYSRSILTANHIQETDKVSFYMNFYREQDNRNRPLFFEFSDREKSLLASVGDNLEAASFPRVDSVAFDQNRILYKRVETFDDRGIPIVFYEYSNDPQDAFFAIGFSEVGLGNGDYVRLQRLANGPVYEYVPRVNGVPQGRFSILSQLPAPNKRQMFTTGTRIKLSEFEKIYSEVAFSSTDQNLFSEIDNEDNNGFGIKSGFLSENRIFEKFKGYKFNALAEFEYNAANFNFIDRLRYIEFDRDWSLRPEDSQDPGSERIFNAQVSLTKDADKSFSYRFNLRNRGNILSGTQHLATFNQVVAKRFYVKNDFFKLDSDVRNLKSNWLRYTGDVSYRSKVLVPGYKVMLDRNAVRDIASDSVVGTAMNFLEQMFYLKSNDTLPYSFFADVSWREDKFPVGGELVSDTEAFASNYGLKKKFGNHDFTGTFTYRELRFLRNSNEIETTVLGKIDYLSNLFDGNVRNELSYALGNGREFRREYVYLPVPTGEGTHAWRDDNGDGVQQLNEFYIAVNPEEKIFIKVFVPTTDFIQAYSTIFNYRLNAKFPDSWRKEKGLRLFMQKFSNTTSLNIEKKITSNEFWQRVNPFVGGFADEDLISVRQVIRSTFFFNRASPKYGFDLSVFDSQNKQLLAGGFEDLVQKDWRLNTRFNFNPNLNFRFLLMSGSRFAASDFLDNRNYTIEQYGLGPELAWQPSNVFRSTLMYQFTDKENVSNPEFAEKAELHQLGLDFRFSKAIKTTVNANLKYTYISYNGEANSPTGYEMLQALNTGNNLTWTLNWLQKIGEGLQMNMVYEGRNSQGLGRLVHVGRMQVTALF
ncbi:hypothetical protein Belba_3780 [Belliella baltica DSM 15883]|uniref:Uncharacterized protein n=1 Tax=Belliella baltica (strain DSM 15883 / CIP 108006 / LMG 21964 / BA134) TaxID=866536 RepID=I3ZAJ5_BELBD|nr:hypothetical protein [Belliella baltica]AFL86263.1 hypothetical protein Belba_3780 [Belliella baltica DSM 15883]